MGRFVFCLCSDRRCAVLLLLGFRRFEIRRSNKASACSVTWILPDNNSTSDVVGEIHDYLSQRVEQGSAQCTSYLHFDISAYDSEFPRCNFCSFLFFKAIRLKVNPLYLMIPGTIGCSYAFMLPVSTPPNSIAFSSGHLMVKDMVSSFRYGKCWKTIILSV